METDIWGQLALEASTVYLTDGVKRSPFADTVFSISDFLLFLLYLLQFICHLVGVEHTTREETNY